MYAVIFEAQIAQLDESHYQTAARMRELATSQYGCVDFSSVTEADREISISYWQSLEDIKKWQQDKEHLHAQKTGKERWYKSYRVNICEIHQTYSN